MTSLLGFVLECAATAALVGTAVGLPMLAAGATLSRSRAWLGAGLRADLTLVAGIVPALAALAAMAAAAAPSVGSVLGLTEDHCPGHAHHFHICFIHSSGLRPALAAVGAFALVVWLYRAGALVKGVVEAASQTRSLERLGHRRDRAFPVFVLPGAKLCHATGLWRRRIMLSEQLETSLSELELAGALAHEECHLRRRDPLASFLLSLAGLFVPPSIARRQRHWHREAAEEACDAAAASHVGDGTTVAAALVKVAALQKGCSAGALAAPAFGDHALEHRVRVLLEGGSFSQSSSHWRVLVFAVVTSFVAFAIAEAETLHHGAEHILGHLF